VAFTARDMTRSSLEALGVTLAPTELDDLTVLLEDEALKGEIRRPSRRQEHPREARQGRAFARADL